jgi:hypothetical protein
MGTRALPSPPWTTFASRSPTGGSGRASAACGMRSSTEPARPFAGKISPTFGIRSAGWAGAVNDCDPGQRNGAYACSSRAGRSGPSSTGAWAARCHRLCCDYDLVTDPGYPALFLLRDRSQQSPGPPSRPGLCALAGSVPGPVTSTRLRERRLPNWTAAATESCWASVYLANGTLKWQAYIPAGTARGRSAPAARTAGRYQAWGGAGRNAGQTRPGWSTTSARREAAEVCASAPVRPRDGCGPVVPGLVPG